MSQSMSEFLDEECPPMEDIYGTTDDSTKEKQQAKKRRQSQLRRLFTSIPILLLFGHLFLSGITITFVMQSDQNAFQKQFTSSADQLLTSFRSKFRGNLLVLDALSIEITSLAANNQMTWPMVTLADFATVIGATTRQQMHAETLGLLPVVRENQREEWERFAVQNQGWVREAKLWEKSRQEEEQAAGGRDLPGARSEGHQRSLLEEGSQTSPSSAGQSVPADFSGGISSKIFTLDKDGNAIVDEGSGPFTPIWLTSPAPPEIKTINYNLLSHPKFWQAIDSAVDSQDAVLSKALNMESKHEVITGTPTKYEDDPISAIYYPIFDSETKEDLVGLLATEIAWTHFFEDALPESSQGVVCVVENACGQVFSFQVNGGSATFLGLGDLHDESLGHMVVTKGIPFFVDIPEDFSSVQLDFEHCPFDINVYPSAEMRDQYASSMEFLFGTSLFILILIGFAVYRKSYQTVAGNRSIVKLQRDFEGNDKQPSLMSKAGSLLQSSIDKLSGRHGSTTSMFKTSITMMPAGIFEDNEEEEESMSSATVLFAEISGFRRWGEEKSQDEKEELINSIVQIFGATAAEHDIGQYETVGHCFVAISGKKKAGNEHASAIVQFAADSRNKLMELFQSLSASELSMRFGVDSGYVQTEDDKFLVFGDTVETSRHMMKKGKPNKIHVSVNAAELLNLEGKSSWLSPRSHPVVIKGIGSLSSFWIKTKHVPLENSIDLLDDMSTATGATLGTMAEEDIWDETAGGNLDSRFKKIVDRNVLMMLNYLKKIQARRITMQKLSPRIDRRTEADINLGENIVEEAREVVMMPNFDSNLATNMVNSDLVVLPENVEKELRLFILSIASSYHANDFHNFEHATHAVVSMNKMLLKISTTSAADKTYLGFGGKRATTAELAAELDSRSFGIGSDPLTEFTLMFSALVHDVDHFGVSNYQLVKEGSPLAGLYKKSVAEQNSVDIAWWLLMTPSFSSLREAIYYDATEKRRFRQLLVNCVIATDIVDRDLKVHRDRRWGKAFNKSKTTKLLETIKSKDLQATMVIEHMMQAADIAHTMQNFRTYLKWNERQFQEVNKAFHDGREVMDPAGNWYKCELAFFDKVVIPLTKRLRDSGVFGEEGDQYYRIAKENRDLWHSKGKSIVRKMVKTYAQKVAEAQEDTIVFS